MSVERDAPDVGTSGKFGDVPDQAIAPPSVSHTHDAIGDRIDDASADWLTPAVERLAELLPETIAFLRSAYVHWKVEGRPVIRGERAEYREAADIGLLVWTGTDDGVSTYTFADTAQNIPTEWRRAVLEAVRRRNMKRDAKADAVRRALLGTAPSEFEGETNQPKDESPVAVEELVQLFAAEDGTVEFWTAQKALSGYSREQISLGFNAGRRDDLFVSTARGYTLTENGKEKWRKLHRVEDRSMKVHSSSSVPQPVSIPTASASVDHPRFPARAGIGGRIKKPYNRESVSRMLVDLFRIRTEALTADSLKTRFAQQTKEDTELWARFGDNPVAALDDCIRYAVKDAKLLGKGSDEWYRLTSKGKEVWERLHQHSKPHSSPASSTGSLVHSNAKDSNPAGNTMPAASSTATKEEPLKTNAEPAEGKKIFGPNDHFVEGKRIPIPLRLILLHEMTGGKEFSLGTTSRDFCGKDIPRHRWYVGLSSDNSLRTLVCTVNDNKPVQNLLGTDKKVFVHNYRTGLYEWQCDPHEFIPKFDFNPEDYIVRVRSLDVPKAPEPVEEEATSEVALIDEAEADSETEADVDIEDTEVEVDTEEFTDAEESFEEAGEEAEEAETPKEVEEEVHETDSIEDRLMKLEAELAKARADLEAANRETAAATVEVEQMAERLGEVRDQNAALTEERNILKATKEAHERELDARGERIKDLEGQLADGKKSEPSGTADLAEILRSVLSGEDPGALRAENERLTRLVRELARHIAAEEKKE